MTDANELKRMIEDLAQRLSHAEASRGDEVAALEERIEKLEGKERAVAYDPSTGQTAQVTIQISGQKVMTVPSDDEMASMAEHAARLAADQHLEEMMKIEQHLKRPGGLLEQLKGKEHSDLFNPLTDYDPLTGHDPLTGKTVSARPGAGPGEKVPAYIVDGRVFIPLDKANDLLPGRPEAKPFPKGYIEAKLQEAFDEMEGRRGPRKR